MVELIMARPKSQRLKNVRISEDLGVCASLSQVGPDDIRLVLTDCERHGDSWRDRGLFTHVSLNAGELARMRVSKDRLEQIGFALLARLWALSESK